MSVQPFDEAGEHPGDLFEVGLELPVLGRLKEFLAAGQLKQRNALLHAAAGDAEEVLPVGLGEAAVAFGDVGGDGQGGPVELVGQEEVTSREALGQRADGVGESDGLLVDLELLEGEGHGFPFRRGAYPNSERVERRKETAGEAAALASVGALTKASASSLLSTFYSLLL